MFAVSAATSSVYYASIHASFDAHQVSIETFTERGTADVTLPDGTIVATVCFADTATRFNL